MWYAIVNKVPVCDVFIWGVPTISIRCVWNEEARDMCVHDLVKKKLIAMNIYQVHISYETQ